jgi:hypothetical protein
MVEEVVAVYSIQYRGIRVAKQSIGVAVAICVVVVLQLVFSSLYFRGQVAVGLETAAHSLKLSSQERSTGLIVVARAADGAVRQRIFTATSMRKICHPGRVARKCNWIRRGGGFRVSLFWGEKGVDSGEGHNCGMQCNGDADRFCVWSETERWKAKGENGLQSRIEVEGCQLIELYGQRSTTTLEYLISLQRRQI